LDSARGSGGAMTLLKVDTPQRHHCKFDAVGHAANGLVTRIQPGTATTP
ncbi:diadenosine tetraphosphatase, partial [Pseudomonas syringae pv. tagetis]